MPKRAVIPPTGSGRTIKTALYDASTGALRAWNVTLAGGAGAFEAYTIANLTNYGLPTPESGSSGVYLWAMPAAAPASPAGFEYFSASYDIAGISLAASDINKPAWHSSFAWDGSAFLLPPTVAQIDTGLSSTHGSGPWGGNAGTGAYSVTISVTDGTNALQGANVRLAAGTDAATGKSDAAGHVTFSRDAGNYVLSATNIGYSFAPATITIDATHLMFPAAMTMNAIMPAANPSETNAYLTTRDGHGNAKPNVPITFKLVRGPGAAGNSYDASEFIATSDSSGLLQVMLLQSAVYDAYRGEGANRMKFATPATSTYPLPEQLGLDS